MRDLPCTNPSLIVRLAAADDRLAWEQFVEVYAPLVFAFAQRRGLQDADAADVVQQVLTRLADASTTARGDCSAAGCSRSPVTKYATRWPPAAAVNKPAVAQPSS
jgi:hypothetical protein